MNAKALLAKTLLIDLDGTLTDPKIGILGSTRYALAKMGRTSPSDEMLVTFIGPPLRKMFEALLETSDKVFLEKAVVHYREHQSDIGMYDGRVYADVPLMLQRATESSSKMFVATSKSRPFAERILRHFGLDSFFHGVYGAELDGRLENKAELLGHLLKMENVARQDACMIGDRGVDIIAAKANRVQAIGTLWGYGSELELIRAGADRLCKSPGQLASVLALTILDAATDSDVATARALFQEYAAELNVDLGFQNFAGELEQIRETYGTPRGCLLLARENDSVIGCVALRPFQDDVCEMKRMYLRPEARRNGAGLNLAVAVIQRARALGYRRMVLDMLESLHAARSLYGSLGFKEVPPYYDNPLGGAIYMELDLVD